MADPKEVQPDYQQPTDSDIHSHSGSDQPKIDDLQVRTLSALKITTGILQSKTGKTYFDLDNDLIIMNDGTTNRLGIGNFDNL